ncbi:MAG: glycosyltransferase [Methylotenera sp.]|nr:glycosyltransferase [Methylotenera sp.]MDP2404444.1 glycosyltransferase [Methylotenera sp.]MDP3094164.1 glycosyltransferase [Methylotenera sp.]MDZ4222469.1 glycosyltransferase [Methylotenera sp.]
MNAQTKLVTILVPNYKTLEITKICMRLLRKYTNLDQVKVIAIDNNSQDASVEYLRSLPWVKLIERMPEAADTVPLPHSRALDLALASESPYVQSIHTDIFVKRADWLDVLLKPFNVNLKLAGVGSWKLESKNCLQRWGIRFEQVWKKCLHDVFGYQGYNANRLDETKYYLRSHCAMYRTDVICELNANFSDGNVTAGKVMHEKMVPAGYDMLFLDSTSLGMYVDHLNHATLIFNHQLGTSAKNMKEGAKRIKRKLRGIDAESFFLSSDLGK